MTTPPVFNMRSYGHHAIYKASGFTAKELSLPRIAVINSWSEQSPGHIHLKAVAEGVKAGIRMAGGLPFEINVPGLCSVPHKLPTDMLYDMPQREAVLVGTAPKAFIFNDMTTKVALSAVLLRAPAMTGLDKNPIEVIQTGDWVKVDADNGTVEITRK